MNELSLLCSKDFCEQILFPIRTLKVGNMSSLSFEPSQFLDILYVRVPWCIPHIRVKCSGENEEIVQEEVKSPNCLGLIDEWDYEETVGKAA